LSPEDPPGSTSARGAGTVETLGEPNLPDGMRKAVYYDPDGNEFGIGGAPV
jgi:hypothetical protein